MNHLSAKDTSVSVDDDAKYMQAAIGLAKACNPKDPEEIPKVGAVIVSAGGTEIGAAGRDDGSSHDKDDHAEKKALRSVKDEHKDLIAGSTVYTTLEPCTRHVRSYEYESCSERLARARVKRVVIGVTDPNPGVSGKGICYLRERDIEVAFFPNDLANTIRQDLDHFIVGQNRMEVKILTPKPNQKLHPGGVLIQCTMSHEPGENVYVFSRREQGWYPHFKQFKPLGNTNIYEANVEVWGEGKAILHIVVASPVGAVLVAHIGNVSDRNRQWKSKLIEKLKAHDPNINPEAFLSEMPPAYPSIGMTELPKGLTSMDTVEVMMSRK